MLILGVDGGNHEVKVIGKRGEMKFFSDLGEYRQLTEGALDRKGGMVYEYEGKKGFAGSLAKYESEFRRSMMGDSKAHPDTKLRILLAVHRYIRDENEVCIVVGQPIDSHLKNEKEFIKQMLIGEHELTVNGKRKVFTIKDVEVAPEGTAAFFNKYTKDKIRIIDVGSGTINLATFENGAYLDRDSRTLDFGMETTKTKDLSELCKSIIAETSKKWKKKDIVYVVGGAAEYLLPIIQSYYSYAEVIYPTIETGNEVYQVEPVYANANGFYYLAKGRFGDG